jgi:hypothetical protein
MPSADELQAAELTFYILRSVWPDAPLEVPSVSSSTVASMESRIVDTPAKLIDVPKPAACVRGGGVHEPVICWRQLTDEEMQFHIMDGLRDEAGEGLFATAIRAAESIVDGCVEVTTGRNPGMTVRASTMRTWRSNYHLPQVTRVEGDPENRSDEGGTVAYRIFMTDRS